MAKNAKPNNIELVPGRSSELELLKGTREKNRKYSKANAVIVIAFIVMFLSYIYSICFFVWATPDSRSLSYFLFAMREKFGAFLGFLGVGNADPMFTGRNIIKYTSIILAGGALAVAGTVFQGGFKNIIASPTTMGVQSGANLGNALFILLFTGTTATITVIDSKDIVASQFTYWDWNKQQLMAIAGAILAVLITSYMTYRMGKGRFNSINILFAGLILSAFVDSITSIIQYYFLYNDPDNSRWQALRELTMGSFDKVVFASQLASMAVILIPSVTALVIISPKLNVMTLGEEEAYASGVNVKKYRALFVGLGTIATGAIIAFCGRIGFVGFIVPQIARKLVGSDFKKVVIISIPLGAILMIWVNNIASIFGMTQYLNIYTSLLGSAMILYAFISRKSRIDA